MFEKHAGMRLLEVFLNASRKEIRLREAAKLAKVRSWDPIQTPPSNK
jgi:hypothetical protein